MSLRAFCVCAMLLLGGVFPARAEITTYANPLDVIIADPFVLRSGDTYYLYGTTDARLGFRVFTSNNLVDWRARGFALRKDRGDFGQRHFWAPEAFEHNGKFYLHYTASSKDFSQRIVLAESASPLGPFKEVKAPWFQSKLCVIDSHVFEDVDGQLYLYYVLDCSENGDSQIYVRKVSDELVVSKEDTFCVKPSQPWEGIQWNEAPFVFRRGDTYIMTYSANCYVDTFYNVGYATAPSPLGPWTKAVENPILRHTSNVTGPGHNAFVESPDGKELHFIYHTQQLLTGGPKRHLAIDPVRVIEEPGKLPRLVVDGPSTGPRPLPSGAKIIEGVSDEFSADELAPSWTTFNEWRPSWKLEDGFLIIQTQDGDVFEERTDLANLFLQYAPAEDFTITTRVDFTPRENYQHASIYVWQDHNHYVKLALCYDDGLRLEVAREIGGKYDKRLADARDERLLRIRKTGQSLTFHVSRDGTEWRQLTPSFEVDFHDVKVGIAAGSPAAKPAEAKFDFFRIESAQEELIEPQMNADERRSD
ncbi:MAG TPA: family 43 glycosylhydrolase [Tepidisphaeraceae bacterium]|nr:family 43 glycosylhydrolase [Tepidisphaeraceae bacterium]